jgi:hypothetical protein
VGLIPGVTNQLKNNRIGICCFYLQTIVVLLSLHHTNIAPPVDLVETGIIILSNYQKALK